MIRAFMSVLLLSVLAYGQPVQRPFTVVQHSGDPGVSNPHLVLRNADTADVFYQVGDSAFHIVVSLQTGGVVSGQGVMTPASGWQRNLNNVIWTGANWVALVYDVTAVYYCLTVCEGRDTLTNQAQIDEGNFWDGNMTQSGNRDYAFALERRNTGGYIAAWQNVWVYFNTWPPPGWSEAGTGLEIYCGASDWPHGSFLGDEFAGCYVQNTSTEMNYVSDDSIVVLESCEYVLTIVLLNNFQGGGFGITLLSPLTCDNQMIEALFTRRGIIYVLSRMVGESGARIIEVQDLSTCIDQMPLENNPITATSDPNIGMAWLSKPTSGLLLSRVDTNAAMVQPEGVLYWPDADHQVVEAKLALADDGKIVALWSERLAGEENATLLKIATIGWSTSLDAMDPDFIPHPSSFNLSTFPNPFNSEVQIVYDLPQARNVELCVFNVLGHKVATLFSGFKPAGSHKEIWKPETGTGIYFVRIKVGESEQTRKVMYLR